jgi:hypothetical protein
MLSFENFKKVFPKRFVKKLESPIVPYSQKINMDDLLNELYDEIKNFNYNPSRCHEHLVFNKRKGVIRISPIFRPKDSVLYYFCVKMIEDEIAKNRVNGTYGGWRLGNPLRFLEEEEASNITEYVNSSSYNPLLWSKYWKEFQKKAQLYSSQNTELKYILKIDIANFYDNINLHILEQKLYTGIGADKKEYIELLLYFLRNWNKAIAGFSEKHMGLPQETMADCSRLLANFYLQDYDEFMKKICDESNSKYLRYADDQIIFTRTETDAKEILFKASKFLLGHGLNLNASKTEVFEDIETYNFYWAFDIFKLLEMDDSLHINDAVRLFLDRLNSNAPFRKHSVLKRILNVEFNKLEPELRHKVISLIYDVDFLLRADYWNLHRIYSNLSSTEKKDFLKKLDELIDSIIYNSYHYNLVKFYVLEGRTFDRERIMDRLKSLKI